jgi:mannose-1-phosphate guanylyltransferase
MSETDRMHIVIMAGGVGTRLWPVSRRWKPKQFQRLVSERTMLEDTYVRLRPLTSADKVWVVTGAEFLDLARLQLPDVPKRNILGEPVGRGSAPAVALAVARIALAEPEAMVLATAADSYIADPAAYRDYLRLAVQAARSGCMVTLGIVPTRPDTRFGYIKRGEPLEGVTGAYQVERFTEKPDPATAAQYVADGGYYWNMGQFIFQAGSFMEMCARHLPEVAAGARQLAEHERDAGLLARVYQDLPSVSLDYGIAEKEKRMVVVPTALEWTDVGSWRAVKEIAQRRSVPGHHAPNHIALDGEDCFVLSQSDRLIVTIGVKGYVIIDTPDALLIVDEERDQLVREALEEIERRGQGDRL